MRTGWTAPASDFDRRGVYVAPTRLFWRLDKPPTHVDGPGRVGLYGFSNGGFVVLSGLARLPDLDWGAAVVHSGPSNLITLATASPPTLRTLVTRVIGTRRRMPNGCCRGRP